MRLRLLGALWPTSLLCRPHLYSSVGFLGWTESLFLVRRRDARTLRELGLTRERLADELERLLDEWTRHVEETRSLDPVRLGDLEVSLPVITLGYQLCPWPHTGAEQDAITGNSYDWRIRNVETGRDVYGPGLIVHLIREHGFFEGRRSPYRVEPRALAEVLGLA